MLKLTFHSFEAGFPNAIPASNYSEIPVPFELDLLLLLINYLPEINLLT